HDAPLNVQLLLSEIDFSELERSLGESGSLSSLALPIEKDLRTLATRLALQLAVAGAAVGALAGIVLPRRHVRSIAAASLGGALAAGISVSLTLITFDERAFEQPHFTGALNKASQVIEATNQGIDSFEELGSSYEALAQRVSTLLALAADRPLDIEEDAPRILHVGDIHSNPLGIEFVRRLARAFEVDAILDTGDLTSFGAPVEARLVRLLSNMPAPYYFVPGNHDSASVRAAIDAVPNVTVMDGSLQAVAGVPMIGWPDPTFTASNEISSDEGNEIRLETAAEVREAVVESRPEVLAVHDLRLAAESMGEVDVVLAGHTHERAVNELSGTMVLVVGSSGATGLGSFLVETDIPYQAEIVYLQEDRVIV
ncbi:MAG: metallophosphoesterase family protein, partial [Gammaproteobacteria bacterium]